MQIGAELLCKSAKVAYASIEYGVLSIGRGRAQRRQHRGVNRSSFLVSCSWLDWAPGEVSREDEVLKEGHHRTCKGANRSGAPVQKCKSQILGSKGAAEGNRIIGSGY